MKGLNVDDISQAIIGLIRVGAVFRFLYCMVRLQGAEEEQAQYRKRAKNTVMFYVIAESIWQIRDIVMYYYK
ncbi:MAG TPA: mercury transporter [Lachnospiraceae bacterium]|nr:mercury transporter [Lachnospiraceae bacterium]